MIKLKSLLKEKTEPVDSDQWDDWYQYFDYFDYDIEKEEILKLINRHKLIGEKYLNGKIIKLSDKKDEVYLQYDTDAGVANLIKDIKQWVYDLSDSDFLDLGININKIYSNYTECTLEELRKNPGVVYHWTEGDAWEEIQKEGYMIGSRGSGINNHGAFGIFTSINQEEYASGIYGNVCLEINLSTFMKDAGISIMNLDFEPEVEEFLLREQLISLLKIESRDDISSDVSPYTIIVNHKISIKYIKSI